MKLTKFVIIFLSGIFFFFLPGCKKFGFGTKASMVPETPISIVADTCFQGLSEENVALEMGEDGSISIRLKWEAPALDANASYKVFGDMKFSDLLAKVTETEWVKKNVVLGETYIFAVKAITDKCEDKNEKFVVFEAPMARPDFFGVKRALPTSDSKIWVDWEKSDSRGVKGYNIYFAKDLSTPIGRTEVLGFSVIGLNAASNYCFVVRAIDKWEMLDSNTVQRCATTFAYEVPDFSGLTNVEQIQSKHGLTQLKLNWSEAGGNVTGYRIYGSKNSQGENFKQSSNAIGANASDPLIGSYIIGGDVTSAIVDGLTANTKYYFVVRAFYKDGNSKIRGEENYIEKSASTLATVPPPIPPLILSVSPSSGPFQGGNTITLLGENFLSDISVKIGGSSCTNTPSPMSKGTMVQCTVPARTASIADVKVDIELVNKDDDGKVVFSNGYTYTNHKAPVVKIVSPAFGAIAGGNTITILGDYFDVGATVTLGGSVCSQVNVDLPGQESSSISCTTGSHAAGSVEVIVVNPDSQSSKLLDGYVYQGPPALMSLTPTVGPLSGGVTLTLIGTNFDGNPIVTVGANRCPVKTKFETKIECTLPVGGEGLLGLPLDVTVVNSDLQKSTLTAAFIYQGPPMVSSILPEAGGPLAGGTILTIKGAKFPVNDISNVSVGGSPCLNVVVKNNGAVITCTTPSGAEGLAKVVVQNPDKQYSNDTVSFKYNVAPVLTSLSPSAGQIAGGTLLTLTGDKFVAGSTVSIDGADCGNVIVLSSSSVTCITPPGGDAHVATVQVANPDLQKSNAKNFTYQPLSQPVIQSISPSVGYIEGGLPVNITGTGFINSIVKFDNLVCTGISVASDGKQITCVTPAHAKATVDVAVINNDLQTATKPGGFTYSDLKAPTVNLSATSTIGSTAGVTNYAIAGSNFSSTIFVKLDNTVLNCAQVASTSISCASVPAHSVGTSSITITNSDGQSIAYAYQFVSGPSLQTEQTVTTGDFMGGAVATFKGADFTYSTILKIDNLLCTDKVVATDGKSITCKTPAYKSGNATADYKEVAVIVSVEDPTLTAIGIPKDSKSGLYKYKLGPKIMAVYPAYGYSSDYANRNGMLQSYTLTVVGSGFFAESTVIKIAGQICTFVGLSRAGVAVAPGEMGNLYQCTLRAGVSGIYDSEAFNSDGQSDILKKSFTISDNYELVGKWRSTPNTVLGNLVDDIKRFTPLTPALPTGFVGAGKDVYLASSNDATAPQYLAHDGKNLFMADSILGTIRKVSPNASQEGTWDVSHYAGYETATNGLTLDPIDPLKSRFPIIWGLTSDRRSLYFNASPNILQIRFAGGAVTGTRTSMFYSSTGGQYNEVTTDGVYLYSANWATKKLYRIPLYGNKAGIAEDLIDSDGNSVSYSNQLLGITNDGKNLYYVHLTKPYGLDPATGTYTLEAKLVKFSFSTGEQTVLAILDRTHIGNAYLFAHLTTDGVNLYMATAGHTTYGSFYSLPIGGGTPTIVNLSKNTYAYNIHFFGSTLFNIDANRVNSFLQQAN